MDEYKQQLLNHQVSLKTCVKIAELEVRSLTDRKEAILQQIDLHLESIKINMENIELTEKRIKAET